MNARPLLFASSFLLALALACGSAGDGAPNGAADAPASPSAAVGDSGATTVRPVRCGCAIEDVGLCGNYVEIEGEFYELAGDLGLGVMEFCGRDGLQAELAGTVEDGSFVASSYRLVD